MLERKILDLFYGLIGFKGESHPSRIKGFDFSQLQKFEVMLGKSDRSLVDFEAILEFGCGQGRLLKLLSEMAPQAKLYGCDVNRESIISARQKCRRGIFSLNDIGPPLPYDDSKFDLIFAYSVFTHLTEKSHISWLRELSSKLRAGGIAIFSTHSIEAFKRMNPVLLNCCFRSIFFSFSKIN